MNNYQKVFKRYEIKYLITKEQRIVLEGIMKGYTTPDSYGKSQICNLYYDTPEKLLIRRSIEKPVYKEKLRVRSYGTAAPDGTVFVELKKKYKNVVFKRRVDMARDEAKCYLETGQGADKNMQIINEIDYFRCFYKGLAPSVFIAYERDAFYLKESNDFRITLDVNILWRDYDLSLGSEIYGTPLLGENEVLMEVKTANAMPLWLTKFLNDNEIYKQSFSKYGKAYGYMLLQKTNRGVINV